MLDSAKLLAALSRTRPHFPDGRIDYTDAPLALAVSCFVLHDEKLLLLKRSERVGSYRGKWDVVAGYWDELLPAEEKALGELKEETGIGRELVRRLTAGTPQELRDEASGRRWITYPCLAELSALPPISLDWEHTEFAWIDPARLSEYDVIPALEEAWRAMRMSARE